MNSATFEIANFKLEKLTEKLIFLLLIFFFSFSFFACEEDSIQEVNYYEVQVKFGMELPDNENWSVKEAWLVVGDLNIYGMDREEAGFKNKLVLKHAGHSHGEAEMEVVIPETFLLDLSSGSVVLKELAVQEGHYFDGYLRLRPLVELYEPLYPDTYQQVEKNHELSNLTFYFLADLQSEPDKSNEVEIALELESMVTGLIYGGTVKEGGAATLTTVLDLKTILAEVDWSGTKIVEGKILIDSENNSEIYNLIKAKFQNRDYYFHLEAEETH
ncbi:MAG: hypothetical protein PF689_09345 [Deltaproteobacteria bacterium]|jgi:hypothetical protein|nr:hypothetical protein [Deltaproteobacteria bacterium]